MSKTFKDLTDQQQKNHEAALEKLGIDRASVPKKVVIDKPHNHIRDAAQAKMKIHTIKLRDVAHMKELGGVPDSRYSKEKQSDAHITYPKALSTERHRALGAAKDADTLHAALEPHELNAVNDAMRAYVMGDSTKVPKELVALVNTAHFPTEAAVTAADDLVINDKYVISAPPDKQALVAGTITIVKPNGQIVAQGVDLSIQAQYIVVQNG